MAGELGAVVEGDGLAPGGGQGPQQLGEGGGKRGGGFAGGPASQQQAGVALMHRQHGLPRGAEQQQIGCPMTRGLAVARGGRPLI